MEKSFRQTLIAEQGNVFAFIKWSLTATFIALAVLFFLLPLAKYLRKSAKEGGEPAE